MPKLQVPQGFALNVFFNYILLLLQLGIYVGALWGKILVSCMCKLGFQCNSFLQESHHLSAVSCGEGLGGKGTYRGLTLAVILLSGNLNFAYTWIWGMNRKACLITQWVQEQCWNPPLPLTSSKYVFLCKIGIITFCRVVKRMHIWKVHWNCGCFWI